MDSDEEIKNVNFEIKKGEVVLLIINSYCGKSTLFKCLNGLIPAVAEGHLSGMFSINDKDYTLKMNVLNSLIGSVFQNPVCNFLQMI